jgi:TIR domain
MDVDSIPLGLNFVKSLQEGVAKCTVLLAIIGPDWLFDKDGRPRLDDPNDFVRIQIAAALQREIPVIPILLEGTTIPSSDQLPKDLQELSQRQGIDVRSRTFHKGTDRLIRGLREQSRQQNWQTILRVGKKIGNKLLEVVAGILGLILFAGLVIGAGYIFVNVIWPLIARLIWGR